MAKRLTPQKARKILRDKEVRGKSLTAKQKRFFGAIAGGQMPRHTAAERRKTHRSFAENVEAFDSTALGETPPRASISRGHPARDALPRAVGRPGAVRTADGTEPLRTEVATKLAGDSRPQASGNQRRVPSAVRSYSDTAV